MHKRVNLQAVPVTDSIVRVKDGGSKGVSPSTTVLLTVIWDVWPSVMYSVPVVNPIVTSPSVKSKISNVMQLSIVVATWYAYKWF